MPPDDDGFRFGDRVEVIAGPGAGVRGTVVDARLVASDLSSRPATERGYGVRIYGVCYTFKAAMLMAVET